MRLFTKDSDGKFDTPLSVWIGLAFIVTALGFEASNIGPGGMTFPVPELAFQSASGANWWASWVEMTAVEMTLGMNAFFFLTGLFALVPGVLLTMLRAPE